MSNIDPATGLPGLPEGYFWRVNNGHDTGEYGLYPGVEVAIMKHDTRLRWFKRVPYERVVGDAWQPIEGIPEGGVPDAIAKLAKDVYSRYRGDLPIYGTVQEQIKKYAGDYPPKRLEL